MLQRPATRRQQLSAGIYEPGTRETCFPWCLVCSVLYLLLVSKLFEWSLFEYCLRVALGGAVCSHSHTTLGAIEHDIEHAI